ncbi:MAG: toll/interleukin-1 receptor domain-containing protein [Candidatus Rokubacteria bacterium]|nr:toll/interleukin-1 receptor domain-containing protein [Candidatus Rokubacteria bacterium]
MSLPPQLHRFLTNYVAVESDLVAAVRSFAATESQDDLRTLILAVRSALANDPTSRDFKQQLESLGNQRIDSRRGARDFLLRLFTLLAREAKYPVGLKAYDAFISYASADQSLAIWLAAELRRHGYIVWLDKDEILIGHSILDEVYRGVVQSRFLIVLLTRHSAASRWVAEELSAARVSEIEGASVVVLPAKCEENIDLPAALRTKRYADLSKSRDAGLQELMRAMDLHMSGVTAGAPPPPPVSHARLREWLAQHESEPVEMGYDHARGGYKDVVVGPSDQEEIRIEKHELSPLLQRTRVRFRRWGGAPFPYDSSGSEVMNIRDGIRLVDTRVWPYSTWNFSYWRFSEALRLFHRSGLLEDGSINERQEAIFKGALAVVWTVKDVCAALLFAANMLREIPALRSLLVIHRLGGMRGRKLVERGFLRFPLIGDYVCETADVIEESSVVTRASDLEAEAIRVLSEIFWLFNWQQFRPEVIRDDVKAFLAGEFPSTR